LISTSQLRKTALTGNSKPTQGVQVMNRYAQLSTVIGFALVRFGFAAVSIVWTAMSLRWIAA
ncbi:MAG TPA: hypothetical protein VGQ27_00375, partial [Steroidobacteraceae bacterium]|nr:hypothetical protein [Steroidobacteraceae bacterium]